MKVRIKRVDKNFPLPEYQTNGSVGFDIYSRISVTIKPKELVLIPSNLIIETPRGHMLALVARSSTFKKKGIILPNAVGIVDQDFCGEQDETLVQAYNLTDKEVIVEAGERIAQGIFVPVEIAEWEEVEQMKEVSRGGIGSTG